MTRLTVIENQAILNIPVQLQPILSARLKIPIKSYSLPALEIQIKNMIIISFTELGIGIEDKNDVITFLRQTLLKDFKGPKYENLSIEVINLFVSNGIRGHYGTFKNQLNTINIQNIYHWINEGLKSEDYKRSILEYNKQLDVLPGNSIDKAMFSKQSCVNAFKRYKEAGVMPFGSFAYYDIINDLIGSPYLGNREKTLVHDSVIRKEITTRLTEKHTKEMLFEKKKQERRGNIGTAEALIGSITAEFKDSNSLKNLIKHEFLKTYFNQLISENKELELP